MTRPQRIAITGASRGLGAALARQLAGPDVALCLCARDLSGVGPLTEALENRGARVDWSALDVSAPHVAVAWVTRLWQEAPLDMLILNAGGFDGRDTRGALETPQRARALIDTNLSGAIEPALAALAPMQARGMGKLVFISSLVALAPQADAPGYSASKAGLTAFARALQDDLYGGPVQVTIVHAGHVRTTQTEQHIGPLPGLIEPNVAAARIVAGLKRGRAEITFPPHLSLGIKLLALVPRAVRATILRRMRFRVKPPEVSGTNTEVLPGRSPSSRSNG